MAAKLGRFEEAAAEYLAAFHENPSRFDSEFRAARALIFAGKAKDAEPLLADVQTCSDPAIATAAAALFVQLRTQASMRPQVQSPGYQEDPHNSAIVQSPSIDNKPPQKRSVQEQASADEKQLTEIYRRIRSNLDAASKERLKADEIQWINLKDSLAANDPRRLDLIRNRITYLQSISSPAPAFEAAPLDAQIAKAEQDLNATYAAVRARLNAFAKNNLKASEIEWIKQKESFPRNDPRRLQAIRLRINYLQQLQ